MCVCVCVQSRHTVYQGQDILTCDRANVMPLFRQGAAGRRNDKRPMCADFAATSLPPGPLPPGYSGEVGQWLLLVPKITCLGCGRKKSSQ